MNDFLRYNSLVLMRANHEEEHLHDESFYQGPSENFQPLY